MASGRSTARAFRTYVENVLRLLRLSPRRPRHHGQLGSHKGKVIRSAHPGGWHQADLPTEIIADLNPIEQVFAKLKHLLRKDCRAHRRRRLRGALGQILGAFTPDECANYLRNSGYVLNLTASRSWTGQSVHHRGYYRDDNWQNGNARMPVMHGITRIGITLLSELDKKTAKSGRLFSIVDLFFHRKRAANFINLPGNTIALAFKVSIIELSVCFFSSSAIRLLTAVSSKCSCSISA